MDIEKLKEFFFEAALVTYAGNGKRIDDSLRPGGRIYRFERDNLLYLDEYYVSGNNSSGTTMIWLDNQPVWSMQYRGFCHDKRASELVKKAMRAAYQERIFVGGRGVDLVEGTLKYHCDSIRLFPKFQGSDWVSDARDGKDTLLFWHNFMGGLLVAT